MPASSIMVRLYQTLLFLYPPDFRDQFGDEMVQDFEDARADAEESRGFVGLLGFLAWITADLAVAVLVQWMHVGRPLIALTLWTLALASASATAQVAVVTTLAQRRIAQDTAWELLPGARALIAFVLLVTGFLLIVAATISLTMWFVGPARERRHL